MTELAALGDTPVADRASSGPGTTALVVFAGETELKCLRGLKASFQHCFVAVGHNDVWIVCDPLLHRIDLTVVDGFTADELAAWYKRCGLTVIVAPVRQPPLRPAPLGPFTCVEVVKRVLGIHAAWIGTPRQLYRHLQRTEHSKKSLTKL